MNRLIALLALFAALWTSGARAGEPSAPLEDLDRLAGQALPPDSTMVRLVKPRRVCAKAMIKTLPKPGKTQYLLDTLALQGVHPLPKVRHKMLILTPKGRQLMAYVEEAVAERMLRELKPGSGLTFTATYLWNSKHGPGLLITGFEREESLSWHQVRAWAVRWFGGPAAEAAR